MDGRFSHALGQEDAENASENSGELGLGVSDVRSPTNSSSLKRSRRSVQKRVVTVPIGDTDGSRIKTAENGAPPYDSWAWRKYGQKPIKGSPYPRGYYRCSSSKGCPARKQVERSRVDPTMLVITYACDHNHSGTPSRNPTSSTAAAVSTTAVAITTASNTASVLSTSPVESESPIYATHSDDGDDKFTDLPVEADGFTWLSDVASTSEMILVNATNSNSIYGESDATAAAVIFPMEDESLFADLGELPECSVVFQRGFLDQEAGGGGRRCVLRAG